LSKSLKNRRLEKLIELFKSSIEPPEYLMLEGIKYWKVRIFYTLMGLSVFLGVFVLIPTLLMAIKAQLWGLAIFDISAYLLALYIWRAHNVSFELRATIILIVLFSIGVWVIISVGILSGGPAWLFTFAVLSGVFLGFRSAITALVLNGLTLFTLGYLTHLGYLEISNLNSLSLEKGAVAGVNFIFLNAVAAISIAGIMNGLHITSQKEKKAIEIIKQERELLLKSKKNLEEEVKIRKESEEKYRLLAENVSDVIWTMDMDLNYTYISPAIEKIQGWSSEEAAFLTVNDVLTPQSLEVTLNRMAAHMADGAKTGNYNISDRFELELYCKDGTTIWAEILASPILGEGGKPVGILGVTRDITERNKLETQLLRAQKMEAIGTLAGGVAHDLNNILSAQVSYPDLILMDLPEDSPLREPILTIQKSGKKAASIVQDLLTLARRGVVATEIVNLNNIIDDYIKSPECEKLIEFHTGVKIYCNLEPCLLNIMGSSVHLSTTITNLISNAAEAMPGGGNISISTKNRYMDKPVRGYEDVKEGDYVILTVSDSGTGISSGDLEKIFEPFYTKKVMGRSGTGLGMAVVWGTVKDHKGYIEVQSTVKKGTTFNLFFPVTRNEISEEQTAMQMEVYMGKGESILVVDDVEEQREIAFRILRKLSYSVTSVASGEEAVDYLKNNSTDLLVLDMIMDPGIDGLETYKKILELHPGQKAIIASGFSETDMVKDAQRLGAGKYIKKPYTLEKIGLAVKEELEK
jgi:two-component system cell cycle sensor histidine kinase/response regulator CckA